MNIVHKAQTNVQRENNDKKWKRQKVQLIERLTFAPSDASSARTFPPLYCIPGHFPPSLQHIRRFFTLSLSRNSLQPLTQLNFCDHINCNLIPQTIGGLQCRLTIVKLSVIVGFWVPRPLTTARMNDCMQVNINRGSVWRGNVQGEMSVSLVTTVYLFHH